MPISCTFKTVQDAIEHAKKYGGWIFVSKDREVVKWYDASKYTLTAILMDDPIPGFVGPWTSVLEYAS